MFRSLFLVHVYTEPVIMLQVLHPPFYNCTICVFNLLDNYEAIFFVWSIFWLCDKTYLYFLPWFFSLCQRDLVPFIGMYLLFWVEEYRSLSALPYCLCQFSVTLWLWQCQLFTSFGFVGVTKLLAFQDAQSGPNERQTWEVDGCS